MKFLANMKFLACQSLPLWGTGDVKESNFNQLYLLRKEHKPFMRRCTAWRLSTYGVFSGPYFPEFGLNTTEIYAVNLRIQSEYRKMRTTKNSVFRHFSRSDSLQRKSDKYVYHKIQNKMMRVMAPQIWWNCMLLKNSKKFSIMCFKATDVATYFNLQFICVEWMMSCMVMKNSSVLRTCQLLVLILSLFLGEWKTCCCAWVLNWTSVLLKVAYRVQIWKKAFCQNSDKVGYSFI